MEAEIRSLNEINKEQGKMLTKYCRNWRPLKKKVIMQVTHWTINKKMILSFLEDILEIIANVHTQFS